MLKDQIGMISDIKSRWKMRYENFKIQTLRRIQIINEFKSKDDEKGEIQYLLNPRHEVTYFPYAFPDEYKVDEIKVYQSDDGTPYINYNGKRLYLKRGWNKRRCQNYYRSLLVEQDKRSAHCYLRSPDRIPDQMDIVADIGTAEGIFTLDIIDRVKKAYCFECDEEWLEPLRKTMKPYEEKVEIIPKFIGDEDKGKTVKLDSFFNKKDVTYIKADIEGGELKMLNGGVITFKCKVKKALITTYHRPYDEDKILDFMNIYGFHSKFNPGYCLYVQDKTTFIPPFVRRGVLFGRKDYVEENENYNKI